MIKSYFNFCNTHLRNWNIWFRIKAHNPTLSPSSKALKQRIQRVFWFWRILMQCRKIIIKNICSLIARCYLEEESMKWMIILPSRMRTTALNISSTLFLAFKAFVTQRNLFWIFYSLPRLKIFWPQDKEDYLDQIPASHPPLLSLIVLTMAFSF